MYLYVVRIFTPSPGFCPDITGLDVFTQFYRSPNSDETPVSGTLELGDSGYAAVLSADFDVIQLTAPSATDAGCGFIFARGPFPDAAILSRGQRRGFGFGLRVPYGNDHQSNDYWNNSSTQDQGSTRDDSATGWLNYRWPITRELFQVEDGAHRELAEVVSVWYVKDGSLLQVSRISRRFGDSGSSNQNLVEVPYKMGSHVRLGCCCTSGGLPNLEGVSLPLKQFVHTVKYSEDGYLLYVQDENMDAFLTVQCFCDGSALEISPTGNEETGAVDFGFSGKIQLSDEPVTIISIMSLQNSESNFIKRWDWAPTASEIERDLGVTPGKVNFGILWKLEERHWGREGELPRTEQLELHLLGRITENLLSVSGVPGAAVEGRRPAVILSNVVSSMLVDIRTLL